MEACVYHGRRHMHTHARARACAQIARWWVPEYATISMIEDAYRTHTRSGSDFRRVSGAPITADIYEDARRDPSFGDIDSAIRSNGFPFSIVVDRSVGRSVGRSA